jgi:hypothetical protein
MKDAVKFMWLHVPYKEASLRPKYGNHMFPFHDSGHKDRKRGVGSALSDA